MRHVADAQVIVGLGRAGIEFEGLLEGGLRLRVVLLLLVNDPEQVQTLRASRLELQPFADLLERLVQSSFAKHSLSFRKLFLGRSSLQACDVRRR